MTNGKLPKFKRPPLIETVLGAQFESIPGLRNVHLGLFWKSLGADWSRAEEVPALDPQFETFAEVHRWGLSGGQVRFTSGLPPLRLQIRNGKGDRMIQAQDGRFHLNWIRQGDSSYPHYDQVRKEFDERLGDFRRFLRAEFQTDPSFNQWEVTYINRILQGPLWREAADWTRLFRAPLDGPQTPGALKLESLSGDWHFEIPPRLGRLHVRVQHGRDPSAERDQEVLVLRLTARGEVSKDHPLEAGLDLGHEVVVRSFKEMTSVDAHAQWGLIDDH